VAGRSITGVGSSEARHRSAWSVEQTLKEPAVEEPINRWWHRAIAFQLIRPLEHVHVPITPNQITLLSGVAGMAASYAYYAAFERGVWLTLVGACLLFISVILDCADGMLARLRGGGTRFGMLLDGFVDFIVGIAVWYGVSYTTCNSIDAWWAWPAGILVLPTIVVHVALYDGMKNKFMAVMHPPREHPADDGPSPGRLERLFERLYRSVHGRIQRASGEGNDPSQPFDGEVDRDLFRREMAVPMRLWSWLGLGTHLAIMYVATIGAVLDPRIPFWVATIVITIGSNLLMIVALVTWKRAWRRVQRVTEEAPR